MNLVKVKTLIQKLIAPWLYRKASSRAVFTVVGIGLREFCMAFPQFFSWRDPLSSVVRSLKYTFQAMLRICWGRSVRFSYSFTGEDRILEGLMNKKITESGFYVEVGCNDPRFLSNTFLLYKRGWRGIGIDGNERMIRKFRKIRPRDKAVHAVISNNEEEAVFYLFENDVLSSLNLHHIEEHVRKGGRLRSAEPVKTKTLTSVLQEAGAPPVFDLLCIDAEEHDWSVLQSLDLTLFRPEFIVIEDEKFNPQKPSESELYNYLKIKKYLFKGSILKNLYFKSC